MTIEQAEKEGAARLRTSGSPQIRDSAVVDSQQILIEVLAADRTWLILHADDQIGLDHLQRYRMLVSERMRGVPVAYLTHRVGFHKREFYVDDRVLVPRSETELLVEMALSELRPRSAQGQPLRAIDIGTGSGVIAITLAGEMPELDVVAVDVSADALEVARRNARDLGVARRIRFVQSDLLEALEPQRFDLVIANLPYVPTGEIERPPNPIAFEPRIALDGGVDGLDTYRRLLENLRYYLNPYAFIAFEGAADTVQTLANLCRARLPVAWCKSGSDYAQLSRFVAGKMTDAPPAQIPRAAPPVSELIAPAQEYDATVTPHELHVGHSYEEGGYEPVPPADERDWTSVDEGGWG